VSRSLRLGDVGGIARALFAYHLAHPVDVAAFTIDFFHPVSL
jgi:hypothetical protein